MSIPILTVAVERAVTMVRPEMVNIKLEFRPTEKFRNLDEAEQKEQLRILEEEQRFYYSERSDEVSFRHEWLNLYFTIHETDRDVQYVGGECNILDTHYSNDAKRV